jgi:metal-dependent HD superfamily phosphatase/phosphodiesterase
VTFLHHGQHFKAVHLGHHDIEQQQVDILVRLHGRHSLQAVLRLQNVITVAQHLCQYGAVHGGIVRNQDSLFRFTHALTCALTKFNLHGEGGADPHTVDIIVYDYC